MGRGKAKNPIHRKPLFAVWGHGTQESAGKWDEILTRLYDAHDITSQRKLAQATGISESTLRSCGAFKQPHGMTYGVFLRMCDGLGADVGELVDEFLGFDRDAVKAFDKTFESAKARTLELASKFLTLSAEKQESVLQMVGAVDGTNDDDMHVRACGLLSEQLSDVITRCKSWDYIDLS